MTDKADKTKQRIIESAKEEFLENSFNGASLRKIVKDAGVTTGAFYGLFKDKNSLFEAIVGEQAEYFLKEYTSAHTQFNSLDKQEQIDNMHSYTSDILVRLVNYMFDNIDEFRLLITSAEGSMYSDWMERLIAIEEKSAKDFIKVLKSKGKSVEEMNPEIIHMLSGSFIHGVMKTVAHNMGRTKAMKNIEILRKYANAGWDALLDI